MIKIKYIDTFSTKSFHAQINASILKMLVQLYPNSIYYYSSKSSRENVYALIGDSSSNVKNSTINVVAGDSGFAYFLRYIFGAIQNVSFLLGSRKGEMLFFNYNNSFSLRIVNSLNRFLKRDIVIICHGELELLAPSQNLGILSRFVSMELRKFYCDDTVVYNLKFCVLSESILKNLKTLLPISIYEHFVFFEHPCITTASVLNKMNHNDKVLRIGTVGTFSKSKGSDAFVKIVEKLQDDKDIEFSITGAIHYDLAKLQELGVLLPQKRDGGAVPSDEFARRVSSLDYILFLYPLNSYRLTASGALLDAVIWGKPIIALRNDYFENFFMKFGSLGYLLDDEEKIITLISSLKEGKMDMKVDFASISEKLSPESIKSQFKKILNSN